MLSPCPVKLGCFYSFRGICSWRGFLPDGTAKLLCVPFTSLLSFLVDGKNLESRECAGKHSLGCSPHRQPWGPGREDPYSHASAVPPPPRPSSSLWCPCGPGAEYRGGGRLCRGGPIKRRDIISGVLVRGQVQTSLRRRRCQAVAQPAPPVHLFANALPTPKRD